jgi:hypothetical protein
MKDVCIFYGHLVYFTAIWKKIMVIWSILPCFGRLHQEKSGNLGMKIELPLQSQVLNQHEEVLKLQMDTIYKCYLSVFDRTTMYPSLEGNVIHN